VQAGRARSAARSVEGDADCGRLKKQKHY
jgi:hypothetical protein